MTGEKRSALRRLQDQWLARPEVANQVRLYGEGESITATGSPTFAEVRTILLPAWEQWFRDYLEGRS